MLSDAVIDDFSDPATARNGQRWRYFSDRVMGGVSDGGIEYTHLAGRHALRLFGTVSLENNGGFVQAALDLARDTQDYDAGEYLGVAITLHGDGGRYAVNLRTADLRHPWQSYRCALQSERGWHTYRLPFADFIAHRTDRPLDRHRLRRVGLIAIGEAGPVDVAIGDLRFYAA